MLFLNNLLYYSASQILHKIQDVKIYEVYVVWVNIFFSFTEKEKSSIFPHECAYGCVCFPGLTWWVTVAPT